jgi:hypothetical protein
MTRQAFIRAQMRNSYGVALPGFLALAIIVALPLMWYWVQLARPDLPSVWRFAGHTVCMAAFGVGIWFVYVRLSRVEQRNQHWCPQCRKGFGGTEAIVLETGKCHHCGLQVIDDAA